MLLAYLSLVTRPILLYRFASRMNKDLNCGTFSRYALKLGPVIGDWIYSKMRSHVIPLFRLLHSLYPRESFRLTILKIRHSRQPQLLRLDQNQKQGHITVRLIAMQPSTTHSVPFKCLKLYFNIHRIVLIPAQSEKRLQKNEQGSQ